MTDFFILDLPIRQDLFATILKYKEVAAKVLNFCSPVISSIFELSDDELKTFKQLTEIILDGFPKSSLGMYTLYNKI